MNLLFVVVALVLVGLIPVFVAISIDMVRRRRRQENPPLQHREQVQFHNSPQRGLRGARRLQLNAIIFLALAIWAAVLTVHGAPIFGPVAAFVLLELSLLGQFHRERHLRRGHRSSGCPASV
jgi:hypothetical protein